MKLENITKKYNEKIIFDNFNIDFEDKKITVILGESGEGKTTLLNIILGLTDYQGIVENKEKISVVFQKDRLIKNMTVKENLKFICGENIDIEKALKKVNLDGSEKKYPKELSAGMSRRVAILRGLLFDSNILLLDEPFINLDLKNKFSIIDDIKTLQSDNPKTIICVTHDIKEAVTLADRIVIIKAGEIVYDNKKITPDTESEIYNFLMK